eukprot:scaffold52584_cov63-Phaeocystis_antarctica.AAC.6
MAVNYDEIESDRPALEDRLMGQYSADRQREIELDEEEYYDEYEPQSWTTDARCAVLSKAGAEFASWPCGRCLDARRVLSAVHPRKQFAAPRHAAGTPARRAACSFPMRLYTVRSGGAMSLGHR